MPFTERWWNPPMMWPMPGAMALSEHLVRPELVATPLQWAGVNPIAAYNICYPADVRALGVLRVLLVDG